MNHTMKSKLKTSVDSRGWLEKSISTSNSKSLTKNFYFILSNQEQSNNDFIPTTKENSLESNNVTNQVSPSISNNEIKRVKSPRKTPTKMSPETRSTSDRKKKNRQIEVQTKESTDH